MQTENLSPRTTTATPERAPAPQQDASATATARERAELAPSLRQAIEPAVDVLENEHEVLLRVDLPGVTKEGLQVELHQQILSVVGERAGHPEAPFERSFRVPQQIDRERIAVALQHGVATLTLPKREQAKPLRIPVS